MGRLIGFLFLLFFYYAVTNYIYLVFSPRSVVFAQTSQEEVKLEVEVDHVANVLEKFKEKVTLFVKLSKEQKYNYNKYLLEKRLAELKYVVGSTDWDPIEETSSRYATYLGNLNEFIIKNKLKDKKSDILDTHERHGKILEGLQRNFEFESAWWLLLQHDINSTKIFSTQISDSL